MGLIWICFIVFVVSLSVKWYLLMWWLVLRVLLLVLCCVLGLVYVFYLILMNVICVLVIFDGF